MSPSSPLGEWPPSKETKNNSNNKNTPLEGTKCLFQADYFSSSQSSGMMTIHWLELEMTLCYVDFIYL